MVKPDIILRTNRRSLSLTISKKGELIVRAPKRLSIEYILDFIKQKEKWIQQKQSHIISINKNNEDLITYNSFMFCGRAYSKNEVGKIKDIELYEDQMLVPQTSANRQINMVIKWYKQMTTEILAVRLKYFSDLMQVSYESCALTNSKNKWGSCDNNANIKFNYRLCMLPHKIIDYIIIHELAHLVEFNHSKNFYKVIESIMTDYAKYKNQLKAHNYLLQLFRE